MKGDGDGDDGDGDGGGEPVGRWCHQEGSFLWKTSQDVDLSSFESLHCYR